MVRGLSTTVTKGLERVRLVKWVIKARDGKYLVVKTFKPPADKIKGKLGEVDPAWLMGIRRGFTVMGLNTHVSVPCMWGLQQ